MTAVRSAVHVHSDWSYDASWKLGELASALADRRYDVVLMSEHDRGFDQERWSAYQAACSEASRPDCLLVPGIEYSDADNCVHVLVWGEDKPFLGEALPTLELLRRATEHGAVAVMAHPWRNQAWQRFDTGWVEHLVGVELWNRKSDGFAPSRPAVELIDRHGLWPVASLDFHRARQFFPLATMLEVEGEPSRRAVIDAIRHRRGWAEAFGRRADRFRRGLPGVTARLVEGARRIAAPAVRQVLGRG